MKSRKALLIKLLQTLVDEWGHADVTAVLGDPTVFSGDRLKGNSEDSKHSSSRSKAKPNAIGQVERAPLEGEQKEVLLQLAARYDRRLFLPRVSDVREFLLMMGEKPIGLKDRNEAFRFLLRTLVQLPVMRLQQLVQTGLHSGPSELGPLSDAIAAAGERLPRQRQTTD